MLEFGTTQPFRLYIVGIFSSRKSSVIDIFIRIEDFWRDCSEGRHRFPGSMNEDGKGTAFFHVITSTGFFACG